MMSKRQRSTRIRTLLGVLIACIFAAPVLAVSSLNAQANEPTPASESEPGATPIDRSDGKSKSDGTGSIGDSTLSALADISSLSPTASTTNAEVHGTDLEAVRAAILSVGGEPYGEVPGFFVEARIPIFQLDNLNESAAVTRLSQVTRVSNNKTDDSLQSNPALASTLAQDVALDAWHSEDHTGAGQKIGILDLFGRDELELSLANDRIPAPAGTFCLSNGRPCPIEVPNGGAHGVAVAEIIHNVAPDAELYLATVVTTSDLLAAVEWFADQGVTVINRSETSELDGPGDGTGPTASIVDRAVELDMVWVAAAGNAAGAGRSLGQNWVGQFNDPDGNGFHNFANGEERMAFTCGFLLGMRWGDDWIEGIPTDYDLWIYDEANDENTEARGDDAQSSQADVPLEHINTRCNSENDIDFISIRLFEDRNPDGSDEIQILGNQTLMEEWTNDHSATGPGNDSANPGAVIVGATERATDNTLADFSSHGPTFDGRNGVDLLAPSCLPVPDFFPFCFSGTSASAPVIGGLVGVLRGAGLIENAEDVDALLSALTTDAGVQGPDPQHGHGFLDLPSPTALGVQPAERCGGFLVTISGTTGDDELIGTAGVDVFLARQGNDRILGLGGNDIICAGAGNDVVFGGRGSDTIFGGKGADRISGNRGHDVIDAGFGVDDVSGNQGDDIVIGSYGRDFVKGGSGIDVARGGPGDDRVFGGPGADLVFGGAGTDSCPDALEHSVSCQIN